MITTIYLIRHSKTISKDEYVYLNNDISDSRVTQVQNEKIILSIEGEKLSKKLSDMNCLNKIDRIYSSNYVRAMQTAKYIACNNGIKTIIDSRFGERKLGNLEKLYEMGENKNYGYVGEQLLDENLKNVDGESALDVRIRFKEAIEDVIRNNEGKNIVVVSHGAAIKFYLKEYCKIIYNSDEVYLTYNENKINTNSPCVIKVTYDGFDLKNIEEINE